MQVSHLIKSTNKQIKSKIQNLESGVKRTRSRYAFSSLTSQNQVYDELYSIVTKEIKRQGLYAKLVTVPLLIFVKYYTDSLSLSPIEKAVEFY